MLIIGEQIPGTMRTFYSQIFVMTTQDTQNQLTSDYFIHSIIFLRLFCMLNVGNSDAGKINKGCIKKKGTPKAPEYSLHTDKHC